MPNSLQSPQIYRCQLDVAVKLEEGRSPTLKDGGIVWVGPEDRVQGI